MSDAFVVISIPPAGAGTGLRRTVAVARVA